MNDATHYNASDPNSMMDQGETRNAVYNIKLSGIPDGNRPTYSKALGVHDPGVLNNTFYSFGAQHTNIRQNVMDTPQKCNALNRTITDVKLNTQFSN